MGKKCKYPFLLIKTKFTTTKDCRKNTLDFFLFFKQSNFIESPDSTISVFEILIFA